MIGSLSVSSKALLDVTKRIEERLERWQPETVYTHHSSDVNIDRRITFDATLVACRPIPEQSIRSIRCFELGSRTDHPLTASKRSY